MVLTLDHVHPAALRPMTRFCRPAAGAHHPDLPRLVRERQLEFVTVSDWRFAIGGLKCR